MSTLISVTADEETNIQGYLAIDATVNGRSYGGVRMATDLSPDSLVRAARAKTLKYGLLGLPVGGAKAGIAADPEMPAARKLEVLRNFGQALKPLLQTRSFIPSDDLGTTNDDIRYMFAANGIKVPPRSLTDRSSGFYTGVTVYAAAIKAIQHIGLDPNKASVAVEGFGSVGASTAHLFWQHGMRVVAISTIHGAIYDESGLDISELINLRDQVGSQMVNSYPRGERIENSRLAELDVDIFSPCAQSDSITSNNASQVTARIICPGANAPITPEAEPILFQRGILSIPDFMASCGGVLGVSMKRTGLKEDYIRRFLEREIGARVGEVIEAAEKENVSLRTFAERIAEEKFRKAKAAAEKRNIISRASNFALELYRRGIIPYQFATPIAAGYFRKKLG